MEKLEQNVRATWGKQGEVWLYQLPSIVPCKHLIFLRILFVMIKERCLVDVRLFLIEITDKAL